MTTNKEILEKYLRGENITPSQQIKIVRAAMEIIKEVSQMPCKDYRNSKSYDLSNDLWDYYIRIQP